MSERASSSSAAPDQPGPAPARPAVWSAALTLWGVIVAILAVVSYVYFDRPVAEYVEGLPRWVSDVGSWVTDLGLTQLWLVPLAIAYFFCLKYRWRHWASVVWWAFLSAAAAGLLVDVVKFIVARQRPKLWLQGRHFGFVFFRTDGLHTGFPSGHSATIAAVCTVAWFVWPRWRPAMVLLAAAVAASRVLVGAHYPSDVIVGLYVGVASALVLRALLNGRRPWWYGQEAWDAG